MSHYNVLTLILENRGQCDVTLQRTDSDTRK
jgi:hypothetical protein